MEFHTPWAIVASGLGGAAAGIGAVVTVLYLICRQPTTPGPTNTTVVSHGGAAASTDGVV